MTLQAPAWRVQTRPCPFYQQGRCIFSDSCNFLHTIPGQKVGPKSIMHEEPPLVTIQSPQSVRSPPRSPRLSDLLFVLQDVIGKEPEEDVEAEIDDATYCYEEEPTLLGESGRKSKIEDEPRASASPPPAQETTPLEETGREYQVDIKPPLQSPPKSQASSPRPQETALQEETTKEPQVSVGKHPLHVPSKAQKPVDGADSLSTGMVERFVVDDEPMGTSLFHQAEGQPSIRTIQSSPDAVEPPNSYTATGPSYDLLSPVELSHLNLGPLSMDFGASGHDGDVIDSGYGETWKTPCPLVRSPPRSPMNSTFDLLSSPFGSPSARVLSPRLSAFISRSPLSPRVHPTEDEDYVPTDFSLDSPANVPSSSHQQPPSEIETEAITEQRSISGDVKDVDDEMLENDLEEEPFEEIAGSGPTGIWDSEGQSTSVYLGVPPLAVGEVTNAIEMSSSTPVHFLEKSIDFNDDELVANSSLTDSAPPSPFLSGVIETSVPAPNDVIVPIYKEEIPQREHLPDNSSAVQSIAGSLPPSPLIATDSTHGQELYDGYPSADISDALADQESSVLFPTNKATPGYEQGYDDECVFDDSPITSVSGSPIVPISLPMGGIPASRPDYDTLECHPTSLSPSTFKGSTSPPVTIPDHGEYFKNDIPPNSKPPTPAVEATCSPSVFVDDIEPVQFLHQQDHGEELIYGSSLTSPTSIPSPTSADVITPKHSAPETQQLSNTKEQSPSPIHVAMPIQRDVVTPDYSVDEDRYLPSRRQYSTPSPVQATTPSHRENDITPEYSTDEDQYSSHIKAHFTPSPVRVTTPFKAEVTVTTDYPADEAQHLPYIQDHSIPSPAHATPLLQGEVDNSVDEDPYSSYMEEHSTPSPTHVTTPSDGEVSITPEYNSDEEQNLSYMDEPSIPSPVPATTPFQRDVAITSDRSVDEDPYSSHIEGYATPPPAHAAVPFHTEVATTADYSVDAEQYSSYMEEHFTPVPILVPTPLEEEGSGDEDEDDFQDDSLNVEEFYNSFHKATSAYQKEAIPEDLPNHSSNTPGVDEPRQSQTVAPPFEEEIHEETPIHNINSPDVEKFHHLFQPTSHEEEVDDEELSNGLEDQDAEEYYCLSHTRTATPKEEISEEYLPEGEESDVEEFYVSPHATTFTYEKDDELVKGDILDDEPTMTNVQDISGSSSFGLTTSIHEDDSYEAGQLLNNSPTAQLAYLISPNTSVIPPENDTLNSIYDDYSGFSPENDENNLPPQNPQVAAIKASPTSSPGLPRPGFFQERVFTPPPTVRERSTTVTGKYGSPTPSTSSSIPAETGSRGRAASYSHHSQEARSAWSPDSQEAELEEIQQSKKVPFGFRHSLVKRGTVSSIPRRLSQISRQSFSEPQIQSSQSDRAFSPEPPPTSPVSGGLKPLRLSMLLQSQPSSAPSRNSNFSINSYHQSGIINRASTSSTSVSSDSSLSDNPLLSSARSSLIPEHIRNTLSKSPSIYQPSRYSRLSKQVEEPHSAPISSSWRTSISSNPTIRHVYRPSSRLSEPTIGNVEEEEDGDYEEDNSHDQTIRQSLPSLPQVAPVTRPISVIRPPMYAIATPPPTLMFAIASDDVNQVRQVLENGDAGPNDPVGPQSALAFTLTNDQLAHKMEIVKTLLAYGADPTVLKQHTKSPSQSASEVKAAQLPPTLIEEMDPATRYYVERADAPHTRRTSALIHRSFFRPLTRVRYELVGQDRALEQLFRVLSIHSRNLSVTPIVVLLCGPSGHGKSLLARKFGSLLDVPTHTVNMTTLKATDDLWKSYSMSPYETPTTCTLAEFLINNEGKRCVVVLDEIEKTHDEKTLWSLLMPWELGRCAFDANGRHVDVRNVVWLGTSNVGHDLVFEHHEARASPDELMTREEYTELMGLLRPRVSERLGASILSRVTTVLPFVPFTLEEKRAICSEALHTIAGDIVCTLPLNVVESMVTGALADYSAAEGARSLYRAVSNQLVDNI